MANTVTDRLCHHCGALINSSSASFSAHVRHCRSNHIPSDLKQRYPQHWSSYRNMFDSGLAVDAAFLPKNTVSSFLAFVKYMGPVPDGMLNPQRGRIDHTKGYIIGNSRWEAGSDNSKERHERLRDTGYTYWFSSQRRYVKSVALDAALSSSSGRTYLSDLNKILEFSTMRVLTQAIKRRGHLVHRDDVGYFIEL